MDRFLEVIKSSEHQWVGWIFLATGIALSIALPTGFIRIIDVLFHFFIEIKAWKLIFLTPITLLFLNVACDLKLNPLLIDLCFFLSKVFIKTLYYVVGFLGALLLTNLIFGHMNHAAFFALTGFTTYFVALSTHWMILDIELQSRELCIESYC
ncbi:hypothetical protein [Acinetobacter seifertii]|uniref:hypothetical protein n=1 Tax=Acinetobacter seifertii TaxID=1530123 RepID=UPI0011AF15AE|nr:hypothetical protein [Acinetobacter seifertii]